MTPQTVDGFIDAYAVLGVRPDADRTELKAAHRRLVRLHHPDLVPPPERQAATRRVQDVNVAYGLVRDPQARSRYDRVRRVALGRQAAAAAASGAAQRLTETDVRLAAQWETLVRAAGRWAGFWWRRNRGRLRRTAVGAALRTRRAGVDALGRVLWLASSVLWAGLGLLVATGAQRLLGAAGPLAPLTGLVGGALVGSQRGWQRRLRLAGYAPRGRPDRVALASACLALALALLLDGRLG